MQNQRESESEGKGEDKSKTEDYVRVKGKSNVKVKVKEFFWEVRCAGAKPKKGKKCGSEEFVDGKSPRCPDRSIL